MARILVVEDEPTNCEIAVAVLRNAGHQVEHATNGHEALETLFQGSFDLVVMDVLMPVMDGITATRAIRAHPLWHALPVVGVSARASQADRVEMLEAGMDAVLIKPYRNRELRALIESLLE